MKPFAAIDRINSGDFTESEVNLLILHEREITNSKTLRDFGDLIAHPDRTQGIVHSAALDLFCRVWFLKKYQMTDDESFRAYGQCDWFLKRFLKSQIKRFSTKELKKGLGRSQKAILREINSYFPRNDEFPTSFGTDSNKYTVIASDRFGKILNFCASRLSIKPIDEFNSGQFRDDIRDMLKKHEIDISRLDEFLVCICILLHNKRHFFNEMEIGSTSISITKNLSVNLNSGKTTGLKGNLDKIGISIPLLETEIDPLEYFGQDFCDQERDTVYRVPKLSNSRFNFGFSNNRHPKVYVVHEKEYAR